MIAIGICFLPIHLQKKYPFSYTFYRANMRNDVGLFKEMKNESKVSQKMGSSDSVQKWLRMSQLRVIFQQCAL